MKDIKIKDYIIQNFKDDDTKALKNAMDECSLEEDEETLPGMGVFLNLIWQEADDELKQKMVDILYRQIKNNTK